MTFGSRYGRMVAVGGLAMLLATGVACSGDKEMPTLTVQQTPTVAAPTAAAEPFVPTPDFMATITAYEAQNIRLREENDLLNSANARMKATLDSLVRTPTAAPATPTPRQGKTPTPSPTPTPGNIQSRKWQPTKPIVLAVTPSTEPAYFDVFALESFEVRFPYGEVKTAGYTLSVILDKSEAITSGEHNSFNSGITLGGIGYGSWASPAEWAGKITAEHLKNVKSYGIRDDMPHFIGIEIVVQEDVPPHEFIILDKKGNQFRVYMPGVKYDKDSASRKNMFRLSVAADGSTYFVMARQFYNTVDVVSKSFVPERLARTPPPRYVIPD